MRIQNNNLVFSIIVTSLWFVFIFWNRFIRERLPKTIVQEDLKSRLFITIAFLFLASITMLLYYILKQLQIIPRKDSKWSIIKEHISNYFSKQQWFTKITPFLLEHLLNGPRNVYENIIYKRFYLKRKINFLGAKLSYHFQEKPNIPYVLCFILPKVIPWIILFLELTLYNHIKFFYKSLILFLIPLLSSIMLYVIEHHSKKCLDWYGQYFEFEYKDERVHTYFRVLLNPTKEELEKQESVAHYAGEDWFFYQNLYSISYKIQDKKATYNVQVSILLYSVISFDFFVYLALLLGFKL